MDRSYLLVGLLAYVIAGRLVMRHLAGAAREMALAPLNLTGVFFFLFYGSKLGFGIYVALIVLLYLLLTFYLRVGKRGFWLWTAFFAPIAALIVIRYVPASTYVFVGHALGLSRRGAPNLVGISYMAFRCSRLVLEVRNGDVEKPNLLQYLNFAFFLPTMPLGPINTYANFRRGFDQSYEVPAGRAVLRILVGAAKYQFLGNVCNQLTYSGLLLDGHPHYWIDLPVAALFYYLYLYLNFSGFCDMVIGAAGFMGVPVLENFENPLAARNLKEFWNRWHITLSQYMRDLVFSPLSKSLVRVMGVNRVNHAVALAILVTFLLIGIWHGAGLNYVAFGLAQALGVITVHYYTLWLKKRLGREGFKAYNENRWIHAAALVITFCYFAATLFPFANTFPEIREILSMMK